MVYPVLVRTFSPKFRQVGSVGPDPFEAHTTFEGGLPVHVIPVRLSIAVLVCATVHLTTTSSLSQIYEISTSPFR
jgi:hypothetical protein